MSDQKSHPTINSGKYFAYSATKLDLLKIYLSYIDGEIFVWKNDKRRCQNLPFLEKLVHTEPLWYHMIKEQNNNRNSHINKFNKDKNIIMPKFN